MKNKKLNFVILAMMLLFMTSFAFGLDVKDEDRKVNAYDGYTVDWEHILNSRTRQEFELEVRSDTSKTISPSLILSEYTRDYLGLTENNFKVYHIEESITYEYYTQWCTDHTYTDCQELNNGSYQINGGNAQKEVVNVIETLMPVHSSQIKHNQEYFEFDLNDMVLESGNTKKYRIEFEPNTPLNNGDYGIFSIKIDNKEFWDKTHSSDFLISENILYYSFDNLNLSGSNPLDLTPNANDGVNNGATTGQTGILNEAFSLDGSNDYVDFPDNVYTISDDISMGFWIKADDVTTESTVIDIRKDLEFNIALIGGKVRFQTYDGSTVYDIQTTTTLNTGQWYHVVVTYDQSIDQGKIYLDGTLENTDTLTYIVTDGTKVNSIGRASNGEYYDGLIDEVSFWNTVLTQNDVDFLYNSGTPSSEQQYPFTPPEQEIVYTGLQAFHEDDITDISFSSLNYIDIYSTTANFVSPTNLTITYPVNLEKLSGGQANEVFMRVLINGTPSNEFKVASLLNVGEKRSSFYNANIPFVEGNVSIDVQIRRSGNGEIDIASQSISLFTGITEGGLLPVGLTTYKDVNVTASPSTYSTAFSQTLPNASRNNTFVWFIGSIENQVSDNPNDVFLRITNGTGQVVGELERNLVNGGDFGSLFLASFDYSEATTFSLEYKSDEATRIRGYFYTIDFVDNNNQVVGTYINQDINSQITNYFPVNGQVITASSLSFLATTDARINFTDFLLDTNTSTTFKSDTVERDFTAGNAGVLGEFHVFENIDSTKNYTVYSDYDILSGTGTDVFYSQVVIDSFPLNTTINTAGDINLTINQANGTTVGAVTGSCFSENAIKSITSNDTNWVYSGDTDSFIFTYTGEDVATLSVSFTCTDIYDNSETVNKNYVIDTVAPTCLGIGDEDLQLDEGDNSYNYMFNIQCSDSIQLKNFSVSCDNGYTDFEVLTGTTFNYQESFIVGETTVCDYSVYDTSNLFNEYQNTFTLVPFNESVDISEKVFDVNGKLEAFTCPTNYMQFGFLIFFIVMSILIYLWGIKQKDYLRPVYMGIAGFMMVAIPFYLVACDLFLSMFLWVIAVVMLLGALSSPWKGKRDDGY